METYKNSYNEKEDYVLWELHEIRHRLHNARKNESVEEINREALKKFAEWQNEIETRKTALKKGLPGSSVDSEGRSDRRERNPAEPSSLSFGQ